MYRLKSLIILALLRFTLPELHAQEPCLPFTIGNGLSFITEDSVLISKPTDNTGPEGKPVYQIFLHIRVNDGWSAAQTVPFSSGKYTDYHPEAIGDSLVIFISRRPEPGTSQPVPYGNLWMVRKDMGRWSEPVYLAALNQQGHDTYPSFTRSGNLYFNSDRPGGKGSMDIYLSTYSKGQFSPPQPVTMLNSPQSENDLVADPSEEFIIFNRYDMDTGELDLFGSVRVKNSWSKPRGLKSLNKAAVYELTPTLSLDGTIFYYEVDGQVYCTTTRLLIREMNPQK